MALLFSVSTLRWQPLRREAFIPSANSKQAVFIGIGVGAYLLTTGKPEQILTSDAPENRRVQSDSYLVRVFPSLSKMELKLGSSEGGTLNTEILLLEQPSVIVTWARLAETFERVGFEVSKILPISTTKRVMEDEVLFAEVTGKQKHADAAIARSSRERRYIAADVANRTKQTTQVLFLIPRQPALWQSGRAFSDLVEEASGDDVGRKLLNQGLINMETLLLTQSDVIILMGDMNGTDNPVSDVLNDAALASMAAIRTRRVYHAPPGFSGYMATVIELPIYERWLAEILHPIELDRRVRSLAKRIYATELGVVPNEDEIDDALAAKANAHSAYPDVFERAK